MFEPIKRGNTVDIQGLPCSLPPVGYLYDYEKKAWVNDGVHKRTPSDHSKCFWFLDKRWQDVPKWAKWEGEKDKDLRKIADKYGIDSVQYSKYEHKELTRYHDEHKYLKSFQDLQDFIAQCWLWRLSGYWFQNNGSPTYVTGVHWYYLSCYHLDTGLPDYRDMDRQFFYAWQYTDEDPHAMGINYVMKRRGGKSYQVGCIGLEKATRRKKFNVGIQSKTEEDAEELFSKTIVEPFRLLPYFFRPVSDIPATGRTPAKVLNFRSGKLDADPEKELGSTIDYRASNVKAYDGYKLGFWIGDEAGKTESISVLARWNVVKNCLLDNTRKVIGKAVMTTTVDEMNKGGRNYHDIWKKSNQKERNSLGRTNTGLFKFFVPAHYMGEADEYGFPDVEGNLKEILAERDAEDDLRSKSALKRQFPLDEREAFSADASNCSFANTDGLNRQDDILKALSVPFYRIGNFEWKDGIPDTDVEFIETPKGNFKVAWMPDEQYANLKRQVGGQWHPLNVDMSKGGCDPYDHRVLTVEGQRTMSKGAIVFIKEENVLAPSGVDNGPCLLYMARPAAPELFYEDCIKACVFYGNLILIEDNKPGCIGHFMDRGYGGYLAWLPNRNKPGITNTAPTSGAGVNGQVSAVTDSYITHDIHTCMYPELIQQWIDFDVTDTTKSDGAMAFGFARILQKMRQAGRKPQSEKARDVADVLPASMWSGGRTRHRMASKRTYN